MKVENLSCSVLNVKFYVFFLGIKLKYITERNGDINRDQKRVLI